MTGTEIRQIHRTGFDDSKVLDLIFPDVSSVLFHFNTSQAAGSVLSLGSTMFYKIHIGTQTCSRHFNHYDILQLHAFMYSQPTEFTVTHYILHVSAAVLFGTHLHSQMLENTMQAWFMLNISEFTFVSTHWTIFSIN